MLDSSYTIPAKHHSVAWRHYGNLPCLYPYRQKKLKNIQERFENRRPAVKKKKKKNDTSDITGKLHTSFSPCHYMCYRDCYELVHWRSECRFESLRNWRCVWRGWKWGPKWSQKSWILRHCWTPLLHGDMQYDAGHSFGGNNASGGEHF